MQAPLVRYYPEVSLGLTFFGWVRGLAAQTEKSVFGGIYFWALVGVG